MPMEVVYILALVFGLVATVLAFIIIVPEKRTIGVNAFTNFLHNLFNFKYLLIEKILQFCYVLTTCFVIFQGFFMLFASQYGQYLGGYGLLTLVFGPIFVRFVYEAFMLAIILIKNVIQINNKLKNQNEGAAKHTPVKAFCTQCGSVTEDGVCTNPICTSKTQVPKL